MLREVFDGGFGSNIDEDLLFEELFCMYVDLFSAKCRADLPAKHETVVVTRFRTHRDGNGGLSSVGMRRRVYNPPPYENKKTCR